MGSLFSRCAIQRRRGRERESRENKRELSIYPQITPNNKNIPFLTFDPSRASETCSCSPCASACPPRRPPSQASLLLLRRAQATGRARQTSGAASCGESQRGAWQARLPHPHQPRSGPRRPHRLLLLAPPSTSESQRREKSEKSCVRVDPMWNTTESQGEEGEDRRAKAPLSLTVSPCQSDCESLSVVSTCRR